MKIKHEHIKIAATVKTVACGGLALLLGLVGIVEAADGQQKKPHDASATTNKMTHSNMSKLLDNPGSHHHLNRQHESCNECMFQRSTGWLSRTDFSASIKHSESPTWAIETVQPLWQTPDTLASTFFLQGRVAHSGHDNTINLGAGYRYLTSDENFLYGINGFYDATTRYHHHRTGLGGEVFTKVATWRANYYHAESRDKIIKTENGISTTQQALSGWDADIDVPVPYVAWSRFGFTYSHWNTARLTHLNGQKFWLRMNWSDNWQTEVGRSTDRVATPKLFAKLNFVLGKNPSNEFTWQDDRHMDEPVAKLDLAKHTLEKVRRHNEMVVEESTSGGAGIAIARGT